MKKFKGLLALILAVAMIVSVFAGCGGSGGSSGGGGGAPDSGSAAEEPDAGGGGGDNADRVLNYGISGDTGTLHPMAAAEGFVFALYAFYEPLWGYDANGERYNILAEDWVAIDETHYELTVREGVTFSNGNPLTASDVMFSMLMCRDDPRQYLQVKAIDFDRTQVTGDYTMDVYLTSYDSTQEVGLCIMYIMDEESYDEETLAGTTIGTGPYTCQEYVVNSHLTAVARDDYWGNQPQIRTINFKIINEPAQYVNEMETGGIDLASSVPLTDVEYVESLGYNVVVNPGRYGISALYSFAGALGSQEARYAVSYAINRADVAQVMFSGMSEPATYAGSNYSYDYEERYSEISEMYDLDMSMEDRIALAQQYADQSGLTGQTLRIITNGTDSYNNAATVIQENLSAIGVNAEIIPYDTATYFSVLMDESNFDIALQWLGATSMQSADVLANYPDFIPLGWTGETRDAFGEISKQAVHTFDPTERGQVLYDALVMFQEICPWYNLCESVSCMGQSPDVGGVESYGRCGYVYQDLYWR